MDSIRLKFIKSYSFIKIVIAVSGKIDGEYVFITDNPVIKGNRLLDDKNGYVYAYWEKDDSIYVMMMNVCTNMIPIFCKLKNYRKINYKI